MLHTLNPGVPQPGLFPAVISLNPLAPTVYKRGFKNPRGGNPLDNLASFSKLTIPAKAGEDADVPPIEAARPLKKIRNRFD